MTDREKEAIDDLFSLTHINGYINLYDLKKANIYISDLKRWQNGVKVLLNLIQTQQEEIEMYKDMKQIANLEIKEVLSWKNEIKRLNAEIEKKDKIIDKMIDALMSHDEHFNYCDKKLHKKHKGSCQECLKEYFINKVEKESK